MEVQFKQFEKNFNDHLGFTPTQEQARLIHLLNEFTFNCEQNCLFILSGYAGTGKTSMLGAYVKTMSLLKQKTRLMAPTGRAAKVLSLRAGKDALTIHKQIYRQKDSTNEYSPLSVMPYLFTNTVFIVDEASMIAEHSINNDGSINRNILDDLIEFVYSGKNCKLIFLGDEGQLPPVGSSESPALNPEYLKVTYPKLNISKLKLSEVLRQDQSSGILWNATHLRNTIFPEKFQFRLGFNDFVQLNGEELQDALETCYSKYGTEETLIITRSNKRANSYNQQIRARILWFEDQLCQQDCLMVVRNNYYWLNDQSKAGFIANGELLKIRRILKYEHLYGFDFARVLVEMEDYPEEPEFEVLLLLESLESEGPAIERKRLKELFFEIEKDYADERNKRKRYDKILKNPYFNALQVKYAYAVTCHKSQGGQWKAVFIDPGYMSEEMIDSDYYRWLYTAITRASEMLYLVNFPSSDFTTKDR